MVQHTQINVIHINRKIKIFHFYDIIKYDHLNRHRKTFDKHPFMIKLLGKLSKEGTYFNTIKAIHTKSIPNVIFNS